MKCNNENFRKAYNVDPYEKSTKGWVKRQIEMKSINFVNSLSICVQLIVYICTKEYDYLTNFKNKTFREPQV